MAPSCRPQVERWAPVTGLGAGVFCGWGSSFIVLPLILGVVYLAAVLLGGGCL